MMNIKRVWSTVKYMTLRQWIYRIYYMVRGLYKRKLTYPHKVLIIRPIYYLYTEGIMIPDCEAEAEEICCNQIKTVSGKHLSFEEEINWDCLGVSYRLMCFRLNDFKYLLTLSDAYKKTGNITYIRKGFALIDDWIKKNADQIKGDKWNPYVIAERVMNWIGFISENAAIIGKLPEEYGACIWSQANELRHSVEYHLGANHMLSEAKALMYAGVFLQNKDFYDYGKKLLFSEAQKQFLPDGGHYERSISYHVESLQQLFEAFVLMKEISDRTNGAFLEIVKKGYLFLNGMIGCDGHIPLLNDAAYDYPLDARDFLGTSQYIFNDSAPNGMTGVYSSRWKNIKFTKMKILWDLQVFFKDTGIIHYRIEQGCEKHSIYFDVGNGGPDSNLGHTHADSLNLLWTAGNKTILADSGVFTYEECDARNRCRSTKAHNTVEIDNTDSSEVWSAFRVAKRAHSVLHKEEHTEMFDTYVASQNGYTKVLQEPITHTRTVQINKVSGIMMVMDKLKGKGKHKLVLRYHLGPKCCAMKLDDKEVQICDKYIFKCSETVEVDACQIAQLFGVLEDSECIEVKKTFEDEATITSWFYFENNIEQLKGVDSNGLM